jgi:hypothetical protein
LLRALPSTRVQGLLAGGHQVQVGLPSAADAARMLLAAAGVEPGQREPKVGPKLLQGNRSRTAMGCRLLLRMR